MKRMKIKCLLLLAGLLLTTGAKAQTDAEYDAAMAKVVFNTADANARFWITTTYEGTKYYLTMSGTLTTSSSTAGKFYFVKVDASGKYKEYGVRPFIASNQAFTNPAGNATAITQNGALQIRTSSTIRTDYDTQVFYLGSEGHYAIRATNASGTNYGANSYWYVRESGSSVVADYDTTQGVPHYIWDIEWAAAFSTNYLYKIQSASSTITTGTKPFFQSPLNNDSNDGLLYLTTTTSKAATLYVIADAENPGYFYLFDTTSGKYISPAANSTNNTQWRVSATPVTVKIYPNGNNYVVSDGTTFANASRLSGSTANAASSYTRVINYSNFTDNGNQWSISGTAFTRVDLNSLNASVNPADYITAAAGVNLPVTYTATVGDADYGTLVVPFDATVSGDVEAYDLTGVSGSVIASEQVTEITANKPVLLKNAGTLTLNGNITAVPDELMNGVLTGVYSQTDAPVGSYVLQNKDSQVGFYKVTDGHQPKVGAFRAYLQTGVAPARLWFGEDVLAGISEELIVNSEEFATATVYDLQGRMVNSQLKKGLYIVNGKKVIIK